MDKRENKEKKDKNEKLPETEAVSSGVGHGASRGAAGSAVEF